MRARLSGWGLCLALALGSMIAAGTCSLAAPPGGPIAAIYPPWWTAKESLVAAAKGGLPVRFGAGGFVVVVVPDNPGSAQLLLQAGAWFLLDPKFLGGCVTAEQPALEPT